MVRGGNPSTREAEAEESKARGHLGLNSEISQKQATRQTQIVKLFLGPLGLGDSQPCLCYLPASVG
jgi:hypothetical protein